MKKIKIMSEVLANKIAAGEIIERPLSVVKELVENSMDANSKNISVELGQSGLEYIKVSDDGDGMDYDDLILCTHRHATSKLYDDRELFRIKTLGFRGEALASIFVVSKLEITTKTQETSGLKLISSGDGEFEVIDFPANVGCEVLVKNLFFNTPVRYKHLSNPFYELSLIINYLNKVALSNPEISIKLSNDDKVLFKTSGNGKIIDVFSQVYSNEIALNLFDEQVESDNFSVNLHFANPKYTRTKKTFITITINNRIIKNYKIERQILNSFKDYLHTNQYPIILLNITVDYSLVDVNIHPTKQEVNISLIDELNQLIDQGIKRALNDFMYVPEVSIEPEKDDFVLMEEKFKSEDLLIEKTAFNFDQIMEEEKADEEDEKTSIPWKLPHFDYIGTYRNTYLLFENKEGLYLVDQHAAQERINYEKFMYKFANRKFELQQLLIPILIEFTQDESVNLNENYDVLNEIGIIVEQFGINTIRVVEVDNFYLKAGNLESDIRNLLDIINRGKTLKFEKLYEEVAIQMACKGSIKANQYINSNDVISLIKQLNECEFPYTCPHGRPIIINLTNHEIEKLFKRVI